MEIFSRLYSVVRKTNSDRSQINVSTESKSHLFYTCNKKPLMCGDLFNPREKALDIEACEYIEYWLSRWWIVCWLFAAEHSESVASSKPACRSNQVFVFTGPKETHEKNTAENKMKWNRKPTSTFQSNIKNKNDSPMAINKVLRDSLWDESKI